MLMVVYRPLPPPNKVVYICWGICFFTYVSVYAVMYLVAPLVGPIEHLTSFQVHAFCSLAGCLMMARSPASAIAVLKVRGTAPAAC